ncbi:MAG TPA: 16S rRNA (cytosine(1402)-N(4))-methyltransferase, partial [Candidatus Goldiibacteriota bacterium]|nr:16S rRNA (cytosine(1402)-N(4))-methyltransferase [Candidatus Goldiibacteriota bacterium]
MKYEHTPVLLNEAIDFLNIRNRDGIWVDATLGLGGHSG